MLNLGQAALGANFQQVPGLLAGGRNAAFQAIGFRRRKRPAAVDYESFAPLSASNQNFAGLTAGMDKYSSQQTSPGEMQARGRSDAMFANSANDPRRAMFEAQDPMLGAISGRRLRVMSKGS